MDISRDHYEKLGKFYLGREYDLRHKKLYEDLVLYDSKDLVTHGVVLGMTGSGKTGLCIALLEEAAMDNIPAIVIDPKGDISNLMLTFPDLEGEDFRPWINEDDAHKKGMSPDEYAEATATLWKNGLADWGVSSERIREFKNKVDMAVYTPGSNAGLPVSILSSLKVPEFEVIDDSEAFAERIETTVSSLLSLIGIDADPIQDQEHILLSNIFSKSWREGYDMTLESLIQQIQIPPFTKIGVMDIETVCPEKERKELALKMNNLLASPGFATWMQGEALDIKRMMHTPEGKPRISVFSIAHLGDAERMFFVSMLLNQILGWMRTQSGTSSLRSILYMDEIYGYLPPTASPPSKKPLMTMLKQARAFGLGILLATQNPVDLDYKALSNIGTWFLGRLQTERDKARVLDGLEGAAVSTDGGFDRSAMEELLAGLGSRVFLMNNVHDDEPIVFHVRWVMSYLTGPLAKRQIKKLMDPRRSKIQSTRSSESNRDVAAEPPTTKKERRPSLPRGVEDFFVPIRSGKSSKNVHYVPSVMRIGSVKYQDNKKRISGTITVAKMNDIDLQTGDVAWENLQNLPDDLAFYELENNPIPEATYSEIPEPLLSNKLWIRQKSEFVDDLYRTHSLEIYKSMATGIFSQIGETEGNFRVRLVHAAHEIRDDKIEKLREAYLKKIKSLENKIGNALDDVEEQKAQASRAKLDTAIRIGGTLLGAIMGRRISRRGSSAMTGASKAWKENRDVARAKERVNDYEIELEELEIELQNQIEELRDEMDPMKEVFDKLTITPLKKNCSTKSVGIMWIPS